MLRAVKLSVIFGLTPVLAVYIGTAIFSLVTHIGDGLDSFAKLSAVNEATLT